MINSKKIKTNKVFSYIDNNDISSLEIYLKDGGDPNLQRKQVIDGYEMSHQENLLTKALGEEKYELAQLLINHKANPNVYIYGSCYAEILKEQSWVYLIDDLKLKPSPGEALNLNSVDYKKAPILKTMIMLVMAKETDNRPAPFYEVLGTPGINPNPHGVQWEEFNDWIDGQVEQYKIDLVYEGKNDLSQGIEQSRDLNNKDKKPSADRKI